MALLSIEFGPTFSEIHIDQMLGKDVASNWTKSLGIENEHVLFDLSITEWISSDGIAFLFGWIRLIRSKGKKVRVSLPYRSELSVGYFSRGRIAELGTKYADSDGVAYEDNPLRMQRRRDRNTFLLAVWHIVISTGLSERDFDNLPDYNIYFRESQKISQNFNKIIPFTVFDLELASYNIPFYDTLFRDVISNQQDGEVGHLFNLQQNIQEMLRKFVCYEPFESRTISNIITQELFINSLQHSFSGKSDDIPRKECYVTVSLLNKWENPQSKYFLKSFTEEKYLPLLNFFKDKLKIRDKILSTLKRGKMEEFPARRADLSSFKTLYRNFSYLEYTFLDFGAGIPATLSTGFGDLINTLSPEELSPGFTSANLDSQIIEFAMLMDTSRNRLSENVAFYELVPRGLYFLADMVRRYQGAIVVRSNNGMVVYDFSDQIEVSNVGGKPQAVIKNIYRIRDAVRHIAPSDIIPFPGTMYTIIIPEKNAISKARVLSPVRLDTSALSGYAYHLTGTNAFLPETFQGEFVPEIFEYVSILFLYNDVIEALSADKEDIITADIYNRLFERVNGELDRYATQNCLVFFDFAGLKSGNVSWIKILYYLINTPKVNETVKAIIVNLPEGEEKIVDSIRRNLSGMDYQGKRLKVNVYDPFLYRPIPCIRFDIEADPADLVQWIGLKSEADESVLTSLLLGERDNYALNRIELPANTEGNLFTHDEQRLYVSYSGFEALRQKYFESQSKAIAAYLKKYVRHGSDNKQGKNGIFLTSSNNFQFKYLSLYEVLHDKYVARYFAKCILDKYCSFIKANLTGEQELANLTFTNKDFYRFNKIIAVTVSSQLLAVAIRDLLEHDKAYTFLSLREGTSVDEKINVPELIMLSSYYSFESEKPFEKIKENDRVLIVNDVISTGSLVQQLFYHIEEKERAYVSAVFSIADTRIKDEDLKHKAREVQSTFISSGEQRFFTLCGYDQGMVIRKYKGPYTGKAEFRRINPLLNSIVELPAEHSEQEKILFDNFSDLVKSEDWDSPYFKIGHFSQNMTHNGYLTDMRSLFGSKHGKEIIKDVRGLLSARLKKNTSTSAEPLLQQYLDLVRRQMPKNSDSASKNEFEQKLASLEGISGELSLHLPVSALSGNYRPDFIFYPVFSGMERISHDDLATIFQMHPDNIISLQRFDTHKGWRFPFPAKRFNQLTRNKQVLIIDSGSLTGETLIQLIDNIGFLDVQSITVVSIINRIEDFNREFYSRIKFIKVKHLKTREEKEKIIAGERINTNASIVPIDIFFGTNLHIPVYAANGFCPFCHEIIMLESVLEKFKDSLFPGPREYIKMRVEELEVVRNNHHKLRNISYLPLLPENLGEDVDTRNIFIMRDLLGKIDSHRFYPEYFEPFNKLQHIMLNHPPTMKQDEYRRKAEQILICLLHEPSLIELVKNYLNGLLIALQDYLFSRIMNNDGAQLRFYYRWSPYSLLRLCHLLRPGSVYKLNFFTHFLSTQDSKAKLYLFYIYWDILYAHKEHPDARLLTAMLKQFNDNYLLARYYNSVYTDSNREFVSLHTERLAIRSVQNYPMLDLPFENLSNFILKGENMGRHFELIDKLNDLYLETGKADPDISDIRQSAQRVNDILNKNLKPSLLRIVAEPNIKKYFAHMYEVLSQEKNGILYYIERLNDLYRTIKDVRQDELQNYGPVISEMSTICEEFVNEGLTIDQERNGFYRIGRQYPASLVDSIQIFDKRYANKICKISICEIVEDCQLAIHQLILDEILKELIKNARHAYPQGLVIDISIICKPEDSAIIRISQNKAFIEPDPSTSLGGSERLVRYFVEKFRGEYTVDSAPGTDWLYSTTIKLPVYQSKRNESDIIDLF